MGGNRPKRELLKQALNETKAGLNVENNRQILYQERDDESDDSDLYDGPSAVSSVHNLGIIQVTGPGSGLKRSLDSDLRGNPIIKKRQRIDKIRQVRPIVEVPWEGFGSDGDSDLFPPASPSNTSSAGTQTGSDEDSHVDSDFSEETDHDHSSESTSEDEVDEIDREDRKERSSAFKAWATHQVNEALGFTPVHPNTSNDPSISRKSDSNLMNHEPRPPEQEPLPPELREVSTVPERKAFHVDVARPAEFEEARLALPVVAEEQKIMEAIYNHPTVVIWGATGSGKTTQVPQFLFEAGYGNLESTTPGMIGVTQPRRVAAVSMAKRVGDELGQAANKVSYQIRFDSSVSDNTAIKFMTDGILIREIANDFALLKYSVIIIDEAHERSANTDILIGMLSRIVDLRATMSKEDKEVKPLKLIIMSATLRITDFLDNPNLFRSGPPPLIEAEGRQFDVITHFARRTERDYVEEVFTKVCRGHKKLPPGGFLVFLTGQNEIIALAKRLREALANTQGPVAAGHKVRIAPSEVPLETEDMELGNEQYQATDIEYDEDSDDDLFNCEDEHEFDVQDDTPASSQVHVLPLYSQLQTKEQLRVFETPPENTRLIVLATNVAETSLTIPGIRYVFDTGRAKEKTYDRMTGVQSFEIGFISKASAKQREGRAGRTRPGHCYRLYSSAVYEKYFKEHAEPEILRMPVEGVVLQLKSMDLQHVVNFPFPTPPDPQSLANAEKLLSYLGAISPKGRITEIGRELSKYPLSPRFSKMLTIGHQHGCMPYTIALVAALATPTLFIPENQLNISAPTQSDLYTNRDYQAEEARTKLRSAYNHAHHLFSRHSSTSDALKALTAICAYDHAPSKEDLCEEMFLSPKSVAEASNLRSQLISIVRNNNPSLLLSNADAKLHPPSKTQSAALQQITAAAFIDQIAILHSASPSPLDLHRKPTRAIDVPYLPLFPIASNKKQMDIIDTAIFIHPSSILAHLPVEDLPRYIIYSHLQRGTASSIEVRILPPHRSLGSTPCPGSIYCLPHSAICACYGYNPVSSEHLHSVLPSITPLRTRSLSHKTTTLTPYHHTESQKATNENACARLRKREANRRTGKGNAIADLCKPYSLPTIPFFGLHFRVSVPMYGKS